MVCETENMNTSHVQSESYFSINLVAKSFQRDIATKIRFITILCVCERIEKLGHCFSAYKFSRCNFLWLLLISSCFNLIPRSIHFSPFCFSASDPSTVYSISGGWMMSGKILWRSGCLIVNKQGLLFSIHSISISLNDYINSATATSTIEEPGRNKGTQIVMHFCNSQAFCLVNDKWSNTRSKIYTYHFAWPSTRFERHARRHLISSNRHASACNFLFQHLAAFFAVKYTTYECQSTDTSPLCSIPEWKKNGKTSNNTDMQTLKNVSQAFGFTSTLGSTNMHLKQWHQLKLIAFLQCKSFFLLHHVTLLLLTLLKDSGSLNDVLSSSTKPSRQLQKGSSSNCMLAWWNVCLGGKICTQTEKKP